MQRRYALGDISNRLQRLDNYYVAKPDYGDKNTILNRYLAEHVRVDREKSELISREVLPLVEALLVEINAQDDRFGKEILRVGSSTQGLSVNTNGDYDFSVIFKLDPNEDANRPSSLLSWSDQATPMKYGFEDSEENETSSLRKSLKIVRKKTSLPHPGFGYSNISVEGPYSDFDDSDSDDLDSDDSDSDDSDSDVSDSDESDSDDSDSDGSDFKDLQFDGDLIPHLVKCRFKRLLQDALDNLRLKDDLKLFRDAHGPALTLRTEVMTKSDGKTHSVSIDLAIIIRAGLKFLPKMSWPLSHTPRPVPETSWPLSYAPRPVPETSWPLSYAPRSVPETSWPLSYAPRPVPDAPWPVSYAPCEMLYTPRSVSDTPWQVQNAPRTAPYKPWPPPDKVIAILEKGINVVAKKPFFWYVSFVELEKELVSEIDKDGGCRKKVHRIMKSVYYTVCKERPVLTSYMLKNVWFLECEKYPDTASWQPENLWERYYNCLLSLRDYVRQGRLPQYFNRSVNLLKDKNVEEDVDRIIRFDFVKAVSKKRGAEEESDVQPPLKMQWPYSGNWPPMSFGRC